MGIGFAGDYAVQPWSVRLFFEPGRFDFNNNPQPDPCVCTHFVRLHFTARATVPLVGATLETLRESTYSRQSIVLP